MEEQFDPAQISRIIDQSLCPSAPARRRRAAPSSNCASATAGRLACTNDSHDDVLVPCAIAETAEKPY